MKLLQPLINNPAAYLESAGRTDKANLGQALRERGQGSVLRVCLWRD
jgi:hypothetical protein